MTTFDNLKEFAEQRLAAAVDDIFEYFEKTVRNYEEELDRFHKLLDVMLQPEIILRREDVPILTPPAESRVEQQEIKHSQDQENCLYPRIKEEHVEVYTSQEGEQFPSFAPISVKSEDCEEKPQLSEFNKSNTEETNEMETAADGENCGGSKPASYVQSPSDGNSDCLEPESKNIDGLNGCNGSETYKTLSRKRKSNLVTYKRCPIKKKPTLES